MPLVAINACPKYLSICFFIALSWLFVGVGACSHFSGQASSH